MPALYLFNRRTLLAGDDLQLPSLATGFVHSLQLFLFLPILLYYTIELLLTSPEEYDSNGASWLYLQNALRDEMTATYEKDYAARTEVYDERQLFDMDDYYASIENLMPTMQSSACKNATSGFSDMKFPYLILIHLLGMSIYCAISIWYEQKIFQLSSLGTPTMNLDLRAPLGKLIEFKMSVLVGINLILLIYGLSCTFPFISGYIQCFPVFWWFVWFALLATQGLQFLLSITTLVSLWRTTAVSPDAEVEATSRLQEFGGNSNLTNSMESYHRHMEHFHNHNNVEMAEEMWRSRCEGCCRMMAVSTCFLFGGQGIVAHASEGGGEKFYGDIARALADYFEGTLDVVPSDIALGFVMLRHTQAERLLLARRETLQQCLGSRAGIYTHVTSAIGGNVPAQNTSDTSLLFRWSRTPSSPGVVDQEGGSSSLAQEAPISNSVSQTSETDESYETFSRQVLLPSNPDDVAVLEEGAHFARHQLAIYTWILYYYMFPVTGTFRLVGQSIQGNLGCKKKDDGESNVRHNASRSYEPCSLNPDTEAQAKNTGLRSAENHSISTGDSCLCLHERTMLTHLGIEKSDVYYASFEAGFYETPYCIVIDRKWKSVVLSIRGSLTLEDCVVDVLLDPSPLDALGEKYKFDARGQYCHGGVLECTQWLHADLMRHNILAQLLLGENAEFPDYTLRIVGHSLGGGIGVILSLMLRSTFPDLRCTCYSPPGGLLSWKLATECSEFVNTFILDSDIVPRLSLNNMNRLRDEVLQLIARVKMSKYDIAKRIFGLCGEVELGDLDFLIQQNEDMLFRADDIPDSDFLRQLRLFESTQEERRTSRGVSRAISLYPPGKIVHLVKTGQSTKCMHGIAMCLSCGMSNAGSEYTPIRKENDDFNEIEISPTLWTDHFPNRVCIEIEKVANNFGIDTTLGSLPSTADAVDRTQILA